MRLVTMARNRAEFWRTADGDLFASVQVGNHCEHLRMTSRGFKQWLAHAALTMLGRTVSSGTIRDATGALEGIARYEGLVHRAYIRVAAVDDRVYIDLCDERWRAVEIDRNGWRIVERPPVRFERRNGMMALPDPVPGGSIRELRDHVRITDDSWPLVVGWLVGALAPHGPYPVLVFRAQHGAGKSYGARTLRSCIDPSVAPIRCEPREPRDLVISARASHVIALDNLSSIPSWLSDGLCRLATGGGYAARALYTDADEIVIDVQRPTILTGITDVVTAPDLLDRSLLVDLEGIPAEDRETERRLDGLWRAAQPRILGALYTAVSAALARRDAVRIARLPRLADWAAWATAAEPALGLEDSAVIKALDGQAEEAVEIALDASIIARPICDWIDSETDQTWTGTAGDLLMRLTNRVDTATARDKSWPKTPRAMAGALARVAPALRERGVCAERMARGHGGVRVWTIERMAGGQS